MNKSVLRQGFLIMGASLISASPVLADPATTTTTTTTTTTFTSNFSGGPAVVIDASGSPMVVPCVVTDTPLTMAAEPGSMITELTLFRPDDLITRRNDLLTRATLERVSGSLSNANADDLISRIQRLDSDRANLVRDDSVAYYKQVKRIYAGYDRIANDMRKDSGEGEKQLAGNYFVF